MLNPSTPELIRVEALRKEYTLGKQVVHALAGVTLSIRAAEFVAVMGPSGSGKSTLLHVLGGLDRPTSGTVVVGGESLGALDQKALCLYRRRRVGFIFQQFNLLGARTALENAEFPMVFAGVREHERRERARSALQAVGLANRLHHRPSELSGGEQQRVAIARSLVNDPELLLADEPTGNLDSHTGLEVMALLAEVNRQGRTVIVVTHDEHIAAHASRVLRMMDGALV